MKELPKTRNGGHGRRKKQNWPLFPALVLNLFKLEKSPENTSKDVRKTRTIFGSIASGQLCQPRATRGSLAKLKRALGKV